MDTNQYYTNEAILNLPSSVAQDSTINIVRLSHNDAALIISRGKMSEGDELADVIDQQLEKLGKQVKELQFSEKKPIRLGANNQADGFEIQSQFVRGDERVHQYQAAFILPHSQIMMAITYARTSPLTDADATQWEAIKQTIRFRLNSDDSNN